MSSDALRVLAQQDGKEQHVQVNQRMLIDKMLARYSSDFVVCRELIQNSDDAQATSFEFEIVCETSNSASHIQPGPTQHRNNDINPTKDNSTIHLSSTEMKTSSEIEESIIQDESLLLSNITSKFHNTRIIEIRTVNNGIIFNETDWKRVASIAEGNTNVDSVGQFGVGFFSVFSFSEEPIITSGNEYMTFMWRDDNSLTTFRRQLPLEQQSKLTSVILKMRTKYILLSETNLNIDMKTLEKKHYEDKTKSAKQTKQNKTMQEIIPTIDINELKIYFTKVLSFTKYINEIVIKINGYKVFEVKKTKVIVPPIRGAPPFRKQPSINNMLSLNSFIQAEQTYTITNGSSFTLEHITVDAAVTIDEEFHNQIRRILKKSLPSKIQIQLLYAPNNLIINNRLQTSSINNDLNTKILHSLIPLKFENGNVISSGRVFIGLETRQTSGFGMHVYSHLIPTIERENIDLQDAYIAKWNRELLMSIGQIARLIYDHTIIVDIDKNQKKADEYEIAVSAYSFQPSVPNNEIGKAIVDGFFASKSDIFLPVKQKPSKPNLNLMPSTHVYRGGSEHIHKFLSLPLVPFDLNKTGLIKTLAERGLINYVDKSIIEKTLASSVLSKAEFIELVYWVCSDDVADVAYAKRILSTVSFHDSDCRRDVIFRTIQYYDASNIPSLLPLHTNTLSRDMSAIFSKQQLEKQLSLLPLRINFLLKTYFYGDALHLPKDSKTNACLLSVISAHFGELSQQEWDEMKKILSKTACVPTTKGMKIPSESYVPSELLSSELPAISLNILQTDTKNNDEQYSQNLENPVSIYFLKQIGCRMLNIDAFADDNEITSNNSRSMVKFIQELIKKRNHMSEADFAELKSKKSLRGTTLASTLEEKQKYVPKDLHFPSVATELQWPTLLIIDWPDINPHSPEYAFLKEIGVKEVPNLEKLIERIIQEHNEEQQKQTITEQYKMPLALIFFIKKFSTHYHNLWKTGSYGQYRFLPSYPPGKTIHQSKASYVALSAANQVFIAENPLFFSLLPELVELFQKHSDISLLGIKNHPSLAQAFNAILEKKNELLTEQSASKIFAYLNSIEGLNGNFIKSISQYSFIPIQGHPNGTLLKKPSEVFIRSNAIDSTSHLDTRGLIDYVDFGVEANTFLTNIGVINYPKPSTLAQLLIDRQETYFSSIKNDKDLLNTRINVYIECLKKLAYAVRCSSELQSEPLNTRLRTQPWCLAVQRIIKKNGTSESTYKIVKPDEIYLDDNPIYSSYFPLLLPPYEQGQELSKLYHRFGARWVSQCIQLKRNPSGKPIASERAAKLKQLIDARFPLLFVDNRGENLPGINEKYVQLLRTRLSVYEVDVIECSLTFKKETHKLDTEDSSSCLLKCEENKLMLYLRKDAAAPNYFDIANELAQFVFEKPSEHVDDLSNRLGLSIETLERRGIPVHRLLSDTPKTDQPPKIMENKSTEETEHSAAANEEKSDFLESVLGFFSRKKHKNQIHPSNNGSTDPTEAPANPSTSDVDSNINTERTSFHGDNDVNNGNTKISPIIGAKGDYTVVNNSVKEHPNVPDFGKDKNAAEAELQQILKGQSYRYPQLTELEHTRKQINTTIEKLPACTLTLSQYTFHSIPLYIERGVTVTKTMTDQAKQFTYLLNGIAKCVFKVNPEIIQIFRDIKGNRIAFNLGGAIFFNLRYFEQVCADELKPLLRESSSSTPLIQTIINFYFMTFCHELSHNKEKGHDEKFVHSLETTAVKCMIAKDSFLKGFSFSDYDKI